MKKQSEFSRFAFGLAMAFGLPWLLLVVIPYVQLSAIEPAFFDQDGNPVSVKDYKAAEDKSVFEVYPVRVTTGNLATGERLYDSLGCAYCHTQMVRPTYAGADMWRGWGGREEGGFARETRPEDYWGETRAMLGYLRIGPDLSNIGWRRDREWLLQHLYAPRSVERESVMPGYAALFEVRRHSGQPSAKALDLDGEYAPADGFEVVPTSDAEALVDYLLSRKKDAPLPSGEAAGGGDGADAVTE